MSKPPYATKQIIVVRKDLNMDAGKLAAQVAHASMGFISRRMREIVRSGSGDGIVYEYGVKLLPAEFNWFQYSYAKIVLEVGSEAELEALAFEGMKAEIIVHRIVDEGRTVFKGKPTLTCVAFGPDLSDKLDSITGHLRPYHQERE